MRSKILFRMSVAMSLVGATACGGLAPELTVGEGSSAIVVVSADVGEVLVATVPRDAVERRTDFTAGARLVYANVDLLKEGVAEEVGVVDELGVEARIQALRDARDLGLPILLESNGWDVAQIQAVVGAVFPGVDASALENVTVLAQTEPDTGVWSVADTTPAEVERLLYQSAEDAAPEVAEGDEGLSIGTTARAATGTQKVNYYIDFVNAAYTGPSTVKDWSNNTYTRVLNRDVVKVYKASIAGEMRCVVTWRGTQTYAEWGGDFLNQFYTVRPFWASSTSGARVGWFYNNRLQNQRTYVDTALKNNNCTAIGITGHSLGGAMATYYTTYLAFASSLSGVSFSKVDDFAAFNPARVGNSTFVSIFPHGGLLTSKVYCRIGDPVWKVPSNLQHVGRGSYGCDLWGVDRNPYPGQAARTNPWFINNVRTTDVASQRSVRHDWGNHNSDYWKQCQSRTSC